MKIEDQLADILTKALGRVKFVEICPRVRVKKAWNEKRIKEENDGSDFPSMCMAGEHGITVVRKGEHPTLIHGALSASIAAPPTMTPCATQWHAEIHETNLCNH